MGIAEQRLRQSARNCLTQHSYSSRLNRSCSQRNMKRELGDSQFPICSIYVLFIFLQVPFGHIR